MRKNYLWLATAALALTACEKNISDIGNETRQMTFTVQGDFTTPTFYEGGARATRASLTADGKDMTDLWVLDYMDGNLKQQLHQTADEQDFGEPTMELDYGSHHVYFVASRGKTPSLSTNTHTLSWATTSDTFWRDYSVAVTSGTAATHNVTLDRVTTKLTVDILDEIPESAATVELTPSTWYYGLDYLSGSPTAEMTSEPRVIGIPASYIGTTGEITASIFGISGTEEWMTDISIIARDEDDDIIGQATITAAPFASNRVTRYGGSLFTSGGSFSLSLNTTWHEEYTGTW